MPREEEPIEAEYTEGPAAVSAAVEGFAQTFREGGGWQALDDSTQVAAVPGGFLVKLVTLVPVDDEDDEDEDADADDVEMEELVAGLVFVPSLGALMAGSGIAGGLAGISAGVLDRLVRGGGSRP
jgi:hypothetical protein